MIILYRNNEDSFADKIAAKLEDLVVAHKVELIKDQESKNYSLPYLQEGDKIIEGEKDVELFLNALTLQLKEQRSITGDACYIDPKTGTVC